MANGIPLKDVTQIDYRDQFYGEQQAAFGYYGKVIIPANPSDINGTQYLSNVPAGGKYYQENGFQKLKLSISTNAFFCTIKYLD